ncbi:MAG TPA: right-handed parallel beta-helix repeat-containing protein, partial [Jiangellales bacterium]|nr:right-handed parallel beta-helix repeat-containing protein [Jiangellales bacterium]
MVLLRARAAVVRVVVVPVVILLGACTGADGSRTSPEECSAVVASLVEATQLYVDGYGETRSAAPAPSPGLTDEGLQAALAEAQRLVRQRQCDGEAVQADLEAGLDAVSASGPVGGAVLRRLLAVLSGTSAEEASTRVVAPADDLAGALAELAPGSTLRLVAGTYRLPDTLVLLQGVELRGAGAGSTVLTSSAPEAAVLVLTDEQVRLADLRAERTGTAVGSVVIGGPSSSIDLDAVEVAGAVADGAGSGGAGVLMSPAGEPGPGRGTTLEVTDSRFERNGSAGVALAGAHRASIQSSEFAGNGQCGVCFLDASDGAVRGSTFRGNPVGVSVVAQARPSIVGSRFEGGEVGVQVAGTAAPSLDANSVSGASRAGLVWTDEAAGQALSTVCANVPFGIVLGPAAVPFVDGGD